MARRTFVALLVQVGVRVVAGRELHLHLLGVDHLLDLSQGEAEQLLEVLYPLDALDVVVGIEAKAAVHAR